MVLGTFGVLNETARREIRAEMARQNLSQRELAVRLGCAPMYISRRLGGSTALTLGDVEEIARQLGVPVEQLVTARAVA